MKDNSQVDMWQSKKRVKTNGIRFVYTWFHSSTGNRGIGTILMPSIKVLSAWIERLNHSYAGKANYSIFDTSG